MSLSPPSVEIQVRDGGLSAGSIAPDDGVFWVLGLASTGPLTPFTTSNSTDLKSTFGHGDGVEAALYALNNEVDSVTFLRVDPTDQAAGVYGAITVEAQGAGFTATGDGSVKPGDDWQPVIEFPVGGTIGATGIKYRYSLDNGNKYSGERELGTDTSITLPFGGGKYNLVGQELPLLLARLVDVRAQVLDHVALVGSVHGSADAGPYTITAPTNDASALTCCADLRTVALAHVVKVSGTPGIHGAADTTAQTALTALVAPATRAAAIEFIEDFVAIFFGDGSTVNSGHTLRTASSLHGAVDSANVLTSDPAVAGDVVAGDMFYLTTKAPRWNIDKLVEALELAGDSTVPVNGVLEIAGAVLTNGEASAIEDAGAYIASKYRDVRIVGHFRLRNEGESLQAYAAAYALAHPLASSSGRLGRLTLCASMYLPSQLVVGATTARPASFALAPRLARTKLATNPINTADFGTIRGAIRAANGTDVLPRAVDESFAGVCTPVRLWAPMTRPSGIQPSLAVTLAPDESDYETIQNGRVVDAVRKSAHKLLDARLGQNVAAKPGTVIIDPNEKKRIDASITKSLRDVYAGKHCSDAYIVIDPTSVVSGVGTKLVKAAIYVVPLGTINAIEATISLALG
jgi:hypothetical protein